MVTDREDGGGTAVVHIGWREMAEAAAMVRVVVPREEIAVAAVFANASQRERPNTGPRERVGLCEKG